MLRLDPYTAAVASLNLVLAVAFAVVAYRYARWAFFRRGQLREISLGGVPAMCASVGLLYVSERGFYGSGRILDDLGIANVWHWEEPVLGLGLAAAVLATIMERPIWRFEEQDVNALTARRALLIITGWLFLWLLFII